MRGGPWLAIAVLLARGERSQLRGADPSLQVQLAGKGMPGEPVGGQVGQETPGVEVDRVDPRGLDDGDSGGPGDAGEMAGQARPRTETVRVDHLRQALGEHVEGA